MEAVSLGNLTRVIVGHDGVGPGNGWFLDQVVVKEKTKTTTQWCFPCRRSVNGQKFKVQGQSSELRVQSSEK